MKKALCDPKIMFTGLLCDKASYNTWKNTTSYRSIFLDSNKLATPVFNNLVIHSFIYSFNIYVR